jgi:hypothetical protein
MAFPNSKSSVSAPMRKKYWDSEQGKQEASKKRLQAGSFPPASLWFLA